jgi:hypothetical protein
MLKSLCVDVVSALDDYQSWVTVASDTGRISPVQFLAVVLWATAALQGRELSESEVSEVVAKWWQRLVDATAMRAATLGGSGPFRHLCPFDTLTFLEFDQKKVSNPQGWCMFSDDVDEWLCRNEVGAWCAGFFDACGLRGVAEVVPLCSVAKKAMTWSELVSFRNDKKNLQTAWTVEQKQVLAKEFSTRMVVPGAKGVAASMASELPSNVDGKSLSVSAFNALKASANIEGKRTRKAAQAVA